MFDLTPVIQRIQNLLDEDTDQSVTYAALEARLALEKVTYDRLRQRHAYISYADLRGWTPNNIMNTILQEVDEHLALTAKIMIGKHGDRDPEDDEYVEIGTEIGLNSNRITKLWNSLSSVALHVRLPEDESDYISDYGDRAVIRIKVEEALTELRRLAQGKMTYSGFGEEISFQCSCGRTIKRKSGLLKSGNTVSCTNRKCRHSFTVGIDSHDNFTFTFQGAEVPCESCESLIFVPLRELGKMGFDVAKPLTCNQCGHGNQIMARLHRRTCPAGTTTPEG